MTYDLDNLTSLLLQFDALKIIIRRTYISGGERVENSAEHSWHLALACWAFAEYSDTDFDVERLIKLALVHDLGEIDAGDTFLYGKDRDSAHIAERQCVERLAMHTGNPITDMVEIWDEQELGKTKEARLVKVVDRLLPFLHNMNSDGQAWKDHGVRLSQVQDVHRFIKDYDSEVYSWFCEKLDYAKDQGWVEE